MNEVELQSLLPFIKSIQALIDEKIEKALKIKPERKFISPSINELAEALSVAQASFKELFFNRVNPSFLTQYADYHSIHNAVKDALKDNGLSVTHMPIDYGDRIMLDSLLLHKSGQYISCSSRVPLQEGNLSLFVSILNELKKQHLLCLLGISPTNNPEDDDLEVESKKRRGEQIEGTSLRQQFVRETDNYERINKTQVDEIDYELASSDMHDVQIDILNKLRIDRISEIPVSQYKAVKSHIQKIKSLRSTPR